MPRFLVKIADGFRTLFGLVFPMFGGPLAASQESAYPGRRWLLRLLPVGGILGLLLVLNRAETFGLANWIPYGRLGDVWVPLFALCVYAMLWLAWWLYRVLSLGIEPLSSEFPDIDHAWDRAVKALAEASIPLDATPAFLVLGWSSSPEGTFFEASRMKMRLKQIPKDRGEPVRVTANEHAVWITCPGASALGQFDPETTADAPELTLSGLVSEPSGSNVGAGGAAGRTYAGSGANAGATERFDFEAGGLKEFLKGQRAGSTRPTADPELCRARLRHLCRLIARDRKGRCPVNGILIHLPVDAGESRGESPKVARSCRDDLTVAHETFRIRCPTVFLVGDLDTLPGFGDYVERVPPERVNNRRGQSYPLATSLPPSDIPGSVRDAVEWVAGTYFPSTVFASFQIESPGVMDASQSLRSNAQLFRFMTDLRRRKDRLGTLVKDCLPPLPDEPLMFGGCYFAGTGMAANHQAFAFGVLQKLIDNQDNVAWTAAYRAEDDAYRRMAKVARVTLSLLIGLGATAAVLLIAALALHKATPDASTNEAP